MATLKSLRLIWVALYEELLPIAIPQSNKDRTSVLTEMRKDLATFATRSTCSGLPFLTEDLPQLAKDCYKSFATGKLIVTARFKTRGALPCFMRIWFREIYDNDGNLRVNASASSIRCLLQLLGIFYKLSGTSSSDKEMAVAQRFVENQVRLSVQPDYTSGVRDVLVRARTLVRQVLDSVDPLIGIPRHGSGAVSDKLTGIRDKRIKPHHKYNEPPAISERMLAVFDIEHFFATPEDAWDLYNLSLVLDNPHQAAVCFVPKDSRGPRLISMESTTSQYLQQGLMDVLYKAIESHPLTSGLVNFTDQSINNLMSSIAADIGYCTIDLRDASDSITWQLVKYLFPRRWVEALHACRSDSTLLPDGRVVNLSCAFPMGAATCFPVMGLTIWALIEGLCRERGVKANTYVYGDDIITSSALVDHITSLFSELGLVVNNDKTFFTGSFRESCGTDWFQGYLVTPIRFREPIENGPVSLCSISGFLQQIYETYGYRLASRCLDVVEGELGLTFPNGILNHPYSLHFTEMGTSRNLYLSVRRGKPRRRWNKDLHFFEVRLRTCKDVRYRIPDAGAGEMHRWYCAGGESFEAGAYTYRRRLVAAYGWFEEPL